MIAGPSATAQQVISSGISTSTSAKAPATGSSDPRHPAHARPYVPLNAIPVAPPFPTPGHRSRISMRTTSVSTFAAGESIQGAAERGREEPLLVVEEQDTTRSDATINDHQVIHARIPEVVSPLKHISIGCPRRQAVSGPRDDDILPSVFEQPAEGVLQILRIEAHDIFISNEVARCARVTCHHSSHIHFPTFSFILVSIGFRGLWSTQRLSVQKFPETLHLLDQFRHRLSGHGNEGGVFIPATINAVYVSRVLYQSCGYHFLVIEVGPPLPPPCLHLRTYRNETHGAVIVEVPHEPWPRRGRGTHLLDLIKINPTQLACAGRIPLLAHTHPFRLNEPYPNIPL